MAYDLFKSLADYQLVLLGFLGFAFLLQLIYYVLIYGKVGRVKQTSTSNPDATFPPISVVICARNEYENLEQNLPLIAEQDYPNYEIIVVDDCSEDDTIILLERLSKQYPHLRQTNIKKDDKFGHGKKLAVTIGIKSAKNDIIVFTDADCTPYTNQWLKQMSLGYTSDKTEIVLGYCGYKKSKGFLNRIIRCDAFFIGLNYLGLAMSHLPYMGIGRNLSYRKQLFLKNKGFASHLSLLSGDDDLFINEVATSKNTRVAISKDALLTTPAKETLDAWILQKTRHGSTYKRYTLKSKFLLSTEMVSRLIFFMLTIVLTVLLPYPLQLLPVGIAGLRLITIAISFKAGICKLKEKGLWLPMLLFDIISPVLYLALYLKRKITPKRQQWS